MKTNIKTNNSEKRKIRRAILKQERLQQLKDIMWTPRQFRKYKVETISIDPDENAIIVLWNTKNDKLERFLVESDGDCFRLSARPLIYDR